MLMAAAAAEGSRTTMEPELEAGGFIIKPSRSVDRAREMPKPTRCLKWQRYTYYTGKPQRREGRSKTLFILSGLISLFLVGSHIE